MSRDGSRARTTARLAVILEDLSHPPHPGDSTDASDHFVTHEDERQGLIDGLRLRARAGRTRCRRVRTCRGGSIGLPAFRLPVSARLMRCFSRSKMLSEKARRFVLEC